MGNDTFWSKISHSSYTKDCNFRRVTFFKGKRFKEMYQPLLIFHCVRGEGVFAKISSIGEACIFSGLL